MSVSVCTLVRGRRRHLANQMRALAGQTRTADEMVIVYLQDDPFDDLPDPGCPIVSAHVGGEALRLAEGRNRAARVAGGEILVFLDVDCLPGPGLVESYREALARTGGCVMGPVRYLGPDEAPERSGFEALWAAAERHPARPEPAPGRTETVAEADALWSLSFAIGAHDFARAGGFDDAYVGYGGEDTDFSRRLAEAGIALSLAADPVAVHQWHPVHKPPIQHFDDIVRNARLYRARWGAWCMHYWLAQFEALGLIALGREIEVLREPTGDDLERSRQGNDVRFS